MGIRGGQQSGAWHDTGLRPEIGWGGRRGGRGLELGSGRAGLGMDAGLGPRGEELGSRLGQSRGAMETAVAGSTQ